MKVVPTGPTVCWCCGIVGVRWCAVVWSHDTLNIQSALSYHATTQGVQRGEGWRDLGCIPSRLIDIPAPVRHPAGNFAGCYNYFSNLDFMMMFYCSDKSCTFHLKTWNFKSPINHSSSTRKLVVLFSCCGLLLVLSYFAREGVKIQIKRGRGLRSIIFI